MSHNENGRDDLFLDILEKIHDKVEKIDETLTNVKIEQTRQNIIVEQHEARSTASEGRLGLLEKDAQFFRNFITTIAVLAGIATFCAKVIPFLVSLIH
jgi:hypothetical protein